MTRALTHRLLISVSGYTQIASIESKLKSPKSERPWFPLLARDARFFYSHRTISLIQKFIDILSANYYNDYNDWMKRPFIQKFIESIFIPFRHLF